MANLTPKTIAELPNATTAGDNDLFAISSSGTSKSLSFGNLKDSIGLAVVKATTGVTGNTALEKVQNAIANGIIPLNKPFIGYFTSNANYFVCGYIYGSPLNGFVLVGWYTGALSCTINGGTWTSSNL